MASARGCFVYQLRKIIEYLAGKSSAYQIGELSEWLEVPTIALRLWLKGMPDGYGYESFKLPKKNGRGHRKINAPNHNLKVLQRSIYHKLLKPLNLHSAATAYVPGKSIVDNALPHVGKSIVINIDLKDFFGSINARRIYRFWHFLGWDVEASTILKNICCYNSQLPQGSPTSPALSNLCNQLLDARLEAVMRASKGHYTRYSDDLTFSFSNSYGYRRGTLKKIQKILVSEGYEIQKKKKVRIQRAHQRQTATGLVVNEKVNLPRETRRRIRSMRHHLSKGTLSERNTRRLKGYENLLKMINRSNGSEENRLKGNKSTSRPMDLLGANTTSLRPKKILFLASSPMNESRLRLGTEVREIEESLRRANERDQFVLQQKWAVRADDLRRALLEEPQIVHFSGHGTGSNGIVLEDELGNAKLASTQSLADLFELCSGHVECVVLNACYSEIQADAIVQHIAYVIGMSQAIRDTAAIKFSTGFYDALGAGKSIEEAYKFGCNAIQSENVLDYLIPKIKKRP